MTAKTDKIVTDAAKSSKVEKDFILSGSGDRIKLRPVATKLLQELYSRLELPEIPITKHPETGKEVENPEAPSYKQALRELDTDRSEIAMNAFVMFGIELLDGVPDMKWLSKLQIMGINDIDEKDEASLEFAYKKYIVADTDLIMKVANMSGVSSAQIQASKDEFPG